MKKKIFLSAAILAVAVSAYAQGNGQAGITEATNLITGYFDPRGPGRRRNKISVRNRGGLRLDWRGKSI